MTQETTRLPIMYHDLAASIAAQSEAIANGTVRGPLWAAVSRLLTNVQTLAAWTPDDRDNVTGG